MIKKVKKEKEPTLEDIFKDYDRENKSEKYDWGSRVGKEVQLRKKIAQRMAYGSQGTY